MVKHSIPKLLLFLTLTFSGATHAEGLLGIQGGAAQLFGDNFDNFQTGFSVGGSAYIGLSRSLYLGLRVAYNNFSPEASEFLEDVFGVEDGDVDGFAWSVDILPVFRFTSAWGFPVNLFSEAGAGISILNSEVEVTGTVNGEEVDTTTGVDSEIKFLAATSLGISIRFGDAFQIDLFPTLNAVFVNRSDLWVYTTYNLGLVFIF